MLVIGNAPATHTHQASPSPNPRLVQAAHEFEAQMMKELLSPMTRSDEFTEDDSSLNSGSDAALGEFASEALGQAISKQGGFGIATDIVHKLSRSENPSKPVQVVENRR